MPLEVVVAVVVAVPALFDIKIQLWISTKTHIRAATVTAAVTIIAADINFNL